MTRRLLPVFTLLAAVAAAPAADLPTDLQYVPPDSAAFLYFDIAALHDSKLGDNLKKSRAVQAITDLSPVMKMAGLTVADLKSVLYALPNMKDQTGLFKSMTVVSFRKKYDREKLTAALKETAKGPKSEFAVKDNVVTITAPSPFSPDNKMVTTHDLTDDTRVVSLTGLGDEYRKPGIAQGLHTAGLKANAGAAILAGVNFDALPDEIRGENLPPEVKPFRPILMAEGLLLVGAIGKDKLSVTASVKSKTKADAAEVEKSLDAFRLFIDTAITAGKKSLKEDVEKPDDVAKLLDVVQAAIKDAKFGVSDTTTTAAFAMPLDADYAPLFDYLTGGGASARAQSSNNLKQLGLSMHNYESAHGFLPSAASLGKKGKKLLSWRVEILPYVEQDELYKKFKHDEAWDSEHNLKVFKENPMPKVFAIPGTTNEADKKTHYQVFVGSGAIFDPTGPTKITDIQDGTSNTFLVVTAAKAVEWTRPDDIEFDPKADLTKLLLYKDGVAMVAFADGSVRAISEKVSGKALLAFVTRSGGEVNKEDDE